MDNYSIGIKLINDNEKDISVIYLCDQIQKEITIISYYQIQKTRTSNISNVDSFCDVYFVISHDCFLKIINDYETNSVVNEPMATYKKTTSEKIYILNEWQQKRIDIALKQVENGEYITEEEDQKEMQLWFKKEEERLSGQ